LRGAESEVRELGSRRELFVDDWLIDSLEGASMRLHHPQPREVALQLDAPWEGPTSHYAAVLHDGDAFRLYYRGGRHAGPPVTAVALSQDGVAWRRPALGLHQWEGSGENNVVWVGPESSTFTPFLDANPQASAAERYKALASVPAPGVGPRGRALAAFASEDGYRWRRWREEPVIADGAFDSQNLAFWDALRRCYVAFVRDFRDGVRTIKRCTSADFLTWTPPEWVDCGDAPPQFPPEHLYTNATIAYPRAPHQYLSFPMRFVPQRQVVPEHPASGVSDGVFMSSRDGLRWDRRFREAFLRPGRDRENWTERSNGVAWGLAQTGSDELSLYWIEHYRHPTARLRRGTLRLDGFVSLNAGAAGGHVLTRPLRFQGDQLALNVATSAAGGVRVELQEPGGAPVPGYALEDCVELVGDSIEEAVRWRTTDRVTAFAGRALRLRLVLRDADVYALCFRPA
jgi:hypothetical protein